MNLFFKFLIFLIFSGSHLWAAKVPPVGSCPEAYNHLFKNPYENLKYKSTVKKKIDEDSLDIELPEFVKNISKEEFEQMLDKLALSISKLRPYYSSGYDAILLNEFKDFTHELLNKFLKQGWMPITPKEVEKLEESLASVRILLRRANMDDVIEP